MCSSMNLGKKIYFNGVAWFTQRFIGSVWSVDMQHLSPETPGLDLWFTAEETAPSMITGHGSLRMTGLFVILIFLFFFFQLDEKCDKQYSDYSRVSVTLFSIFLLCLFKISAKHQMILFSFVKEPRCLHFTSVVTLKLIFCGPAKLCLFFLCKILRSSTLGHRRVIKCDHSAVRILHWPID